MKKYCSVIAVLTVIFMLFGCISAPKRDAASEYVLTVLHTNDHHGSPLAKEGKGGLAERATFIKSVRSAEKNVLVLDAGDMNAGTALSNMFHAEPDIRAYNKIGYDAVALGNHEFDATLEKLEKQISWSEFPWISANIKKGRSYFVQPYIIKDFEGFRVGIMGLTTLRTQVIAQPDKSLTFIDEIEAARKTVAELRNKKKCDIVIVVGHVGNIKESEDHTTSLMVAESVPGIDLFIDGHSHAKFEKPIQVGNTYIVSANEWGKFIGKGRLTIKNGKLIAFDWIPVEITTAAFPPDPEIAALLKPYKEKADASLKEVVIKTAAEFEFGSKLSRKKEIALGNLVCDAQTAYLASIGVPVDFAITNGGNIRTHLPKGDVTREDILTVLPFENYVYVVTLKGSDVVKLFDFIGTIPQGAGAFAQVSKEVKMTLNYDAGKIENVTVGGKPIDSARTYKIAVNDYLAAGGDGYEVFKKAVETFNTSMLLSDVVIDYVQTLVQPIVPKTDGRITIIGGMAL
ncbi:5'-nucleotidase C-terminal domain-containing protein [Treponema sp. OMZ 840]|uniref:bifunctional metallophosphatase/5'-nucleotidase n=1 Tax=Treponema sp. OMZ 840 TaxID=244313 RepID=UPI003D90FE9D